MSTDSILLRCSCRADTGISFESSFTSHSPACGTCGAALHWRSCPDCETGGQVPAADAPCRECSPAAEGEVARSHRPWSLFAVACPWCGQRFNYLRGMLRGNLFRCTACGKASRSPASPTALVWTMGGLLAWALVAREIDRAIGSAMGAESWAPWRPAVIWVQGGAVILAMVAVLGRTLRLERHPQPRSRSRR